MAGAGWQGQDGADLGGGRCTAGWGRGDQGLVGELKLLGCRAGQRFCFSHPLRAEEFDKLLARRFARAVGALGPVLSNAETVPQPDLPVGFFAGHAVRHG
jgi:hypothetical protein